MNPHQYAQQIKHELQTVTWLEGSRDVVFGARGVLVYAGALAEDEVPPGFPFALVTLESAAMDDDHPELITQDFSVILAVEVAGGTMGEFAVIGGARPDIGKSAGAGVTEVVPRVLAALQSLTGADGARVLLSSGSTSSPQSLGRGKHLAMQEVGLTAVCTSEPTFVAPQTLNVVGSAWSWDGAHCSSRFDFLQYRLGYKIGTVPPVTPDDADGISYAGTAAEASHAPGTGRAYAVFADYSSRGNVTENSSAGDTRGAYVTT